MSDPEEIQRRDELRRLRVGVMWDKYNLFMDAFVEEGGEDTLECITPWEFLLPMPGWEPGT